MNQAFIAPAAALLLDHSREVEAAFALLNTLGVRWCLLRAPGPVSDSGVIEIDLLIAPADLKRVTTALGKQAFVRMHAPGHAPHCFFVKLSPSGSWIKLDVVTDLRFGHPIRNLRLGVVDELLSSRMAEGTAWRPSPTFEFVTLALHVLLDKASVDDKYRERLKSLAPVASRDLALLPSEFQDFTKIAAGQIAGNRWTQFVASRESVRAALVRREPLMAKARFIAGAVLRKIGRYLPGGRGVSVALLAPDGAGKSSMVAALTRVPILKTRAFYMGTRTGRSVSRAMRFLLQLCTDRFSLAKAALHRLGGGVVVFDRYVYDRILAPTSPHRTVRFRQWLLRAGWPRPDLVVVLDAPGSVLFERKREHSPEWLEAQRRKYQQLGTLDPAAKIVFVDATREFAEVQMEVTRLVWTKYAERNHG